MVNLFLHPFTTVMRLWTQNLYLSVPIFNVWSHGHMPLEPLISGIYVE